MWAEKVLSDAKSYITREIAYASEYALMKNEPVSPARSYEIQTIIIGEWAIVGVPCELFAELGIEIKQRSPFPKTVVFELANDTIGYIAPKRIVNSGAYEARVSLYNSIMVDSTAGEMLSNIQYQLSKLHSIINSKESV
jgi:hypothetical protein